MGRSKLPIRVRRRPGNPSELSVSRLNRAMIFDEITIVSIIGLHTLLAIFRLSRAAQYAGQFTAACCRRAIQELRDQRHRHPAQHLQALGVVAEFHIPSVQTPTTSAQPSRRRSGSQSISECVSPRPACSRSTRRSRSISFATHAGRWSFQRLDRHPRRDRQSPFHHSGHGCPCKLLTNHQL